MSESSGILLSGIGQSLIQFADIQHDTKISSLEAEAQRQKEIRLQEMQVSRDAITDSFRLADLESSQERLRIAQAADLRAQEKHDKKSYIWKEVPQYGWVNETVTEYDPMLQENVQKIKKNWEKVGSHWMGINEDDPKDRVVIGADGTYLSGDEANSILQSATESGSVSGSTGGGEITFAEYEANFKKQKPSYKGTPEEQDALRKWAEGKGITFIDSASSAEAPSVGAKTDSLDLAPDAGGTYPEFPELKGPDVPWYQKQVIPSDPTLSDVGEWIAESAQDDNPQHNEMFAKSLGLPVDIVTSVINNVLMPKGSPIETPIGGSKWLMENRGLTIAQLVGMIKESATGEQSAIDEGSDSVASPDPTATSGGLPIVTDGGTGAGYQGLMRQMEANAMEATQGSGPVTSPDATATYPEFGAIAQPAVSFDPSDGMGVNTSLQTGSFPAINTGGQSVPELPPEPDKVVVEAEGMSEVFAYDAAKSKAFIEGLIKEMQAVNISQEDIRKELLSILGEIPKEQANGDFAKAVANAYYEFTKGTN